jgi:hypothetical protein
MVTATEMFQGVDENWGEVGNATQVGALGPEEQCAYCVADANVVEEPQLKLRSLQTMGAMRVHTYSKMHTNSLPSFAQMGAS